MSEWAPLVHGRTAYVDFHSNFTALPEDFGPNDITWAKSHVLAMTNVPEQLEGRPRWCVFRDRQRTVVGVACMVDEVSATHHREIVQTPDGERPGDRRLYVFLGWVSNDPEARLPPMELDSFRDLYRLVIDRWDEKLYQSRGLHKKPYDHVLPALETDERAPVAINLEKGRITFWPREWNEDLWRAADTHHGSVAINLPSARSARDSPFPNVTVADVRERRAEARESTREPQPARPRNERWPRRSRFVRGLLAAALWLPKTVVACVGAVRDVMVGLIASAGRGPQGSPPTPSDAPADNAPPPPPGSSPEPADHRASSPSRGPTRRPRSRDLDPTGPRTAPRRSPPSVEPRRPPATTRRPDRQRAARHEGSDRASGPSAPPGAENAPVQLDTLSTRWKHFTKTLQGSPKTDPRQQRGRRSITTEATDAMPPGFRHRTELDDDASSDPDDVWNWSDP